MRRMPLAYHGRNSTGSAETPVPTARLETHLRMLMPHGSAPAYSIVYPASAYVRIIDFGVLLAFRWIDLVRKLTHSD